LFSLVYADYADKNKVHAVIFGIIMKDKKISNELAQLRTGGDYSSPAVWGILSCRKGV